MGVFGERFLFRLAASPEEYPLHGWSPPVGTNSDPYTGYAWLNSNTPRTYCTFQTSSSIMGMVWTDFELWCASDGRGT